jgi:hypothetical protein
MTTNLELTWHARKLCSSQKHILRRSKQCYFIFVGAYLDWKYYSNDSRFHNDRPFRDGLVYVLF